MRKQPETSKAAYNSVTIEMQKNHYSKILKALKSLGNGIYEELAEHIGMEKNQVSRRLKEMEQQELVYKSGTKRPTKSGRSAYVYFLVGNNQPKTEKEINFAKVKKTATEYANSLIKQTLIWE